MPAPHQHHAHGWTIRNESRLRVDQSTLRATGDLARRMAVETGRNIGQGTAAHIAVAYLLDQARQGRVNLARLPHRYLSGD